MTLEEDIRKSYHSIVEFNNTLRDREKGVPFSRRLLPHVGHWRAISSLYLPIKENFPNYLLLAMEDDLIDRRSLLFADVVKEPTKGDQMQGKSTLFNSLNHTTTALGNATLLRSLVWPLKDEELINAKQDSLRELESNDALRQALDDYIGEFSNHEERMFKYLSNQGALLEENSKYRKFRKAAKQLGKLPKDITPETPYLDYLVGDLKTFTQEEPYNLMRGPVYRTLMGLRSKEQRNFFITPRWRYYPYPSWTMIPVMAPTIATLIDRETVFPYIKKAAEYFSLQPEQMGVLLAMGMLMSGFYGAMMKVLIDGATIHHPAIKKINNHPRFQESMDSLGKIDELLSFYKFGKEFPHDVSLPTIKDEDVHSFVAKGLRNPTLGKTNENFVPNDVTLLQTYLNVITGPNSGGKTTICKSVVQNQILAQIGCYVAAKDAIINIADHIAYQAPMFDALDNPEGRFGTEMGVTKDIYFSTTPRSLVILDELAEGTTMEERMEQSYGILDDFYKLQANVVWVTHNHHLAEQFKQEGKGQHLQVEFKDKEPTHRIIPGISTVSHADRVMEKIGFTAQDREEYRVHLEQEGKLKSA